MYHGLRFEIVAIVKIATAAYLPVECSIEEERTIE
jgi:hypothetical protein